MKRLFAILLVVALVPAGCVQPTETPQTYTLDGLTAEEASEVLEIALSSESFASYRARFKETWVGDVYSVQCLLWVEFGRGAGTQRLPGVQIYFGEDIERRGGVEVLLLVDLDLGEVAEAIDKPLKSMPSRP